MEPSRACPSCSVPALRPRSRRLPGQPTVSAVEEAREVLEERVEVSGLWLREEEVVEEEEEVQEVLEVLEEEEGQLAPPLRHRRQAAAAVASPGALRQWALVAVALPGATPEDSSCCTWTARCSAPLAAAGLRTSVRLLRDCERRGVREHCAALVRRPRSSWQQPPWPAQTCCRAASVVV